MRFSLVMSFIALAFTCWGLYGPVLHVGQDAMSRSLLRPFICVGVAYFVVAVLAPMLLLRSRSETGRWTVRGTFWSLVAGALGAMGALGIVLAFKFRGSPVFIMPIVFGCAPVVNTFVTMWISRTSPRQAGWSFYLSVLLVAFGAAGVFCFKPRPVKVAQPTAEAVPAESDSAPELPSTPAVAPQATRVSPAVSAATGGVPSPVWKIIAALAVTALCWGSYGPLLHRGQAAMEGSRLRPFICVGLAYFAIAVLAPLAILQVWQEPGQWSATGVGWSLAAGTLGAIGALGIIMAFTFGGRPIVVMPFVFGCAPIVNTLASVAQTLFSGGSVDNIRGLFVISLVAVLAGAVGVLVRAPKPTPKPAAA